jgi:CheY-like chemotaxis protein
LIDKGREIANVTDRSNRVAVILVVDDNYFNRELLQVFLSISGYNVIEARNGLEAVRLATSEHPDLIIMDLAMPLMDGYGALRILRMVPEICDVPIVACTAHNSSTHRVTAMRKGFSEFLTKPIDFCALDCMINRFLKAA